MRRSEKLLLSSPDVPPAKWVLRDIDFISTPSPLEKAVDSLTSVAAAYDSFYREKYAAAEKNAALLEVEWKRRVAAETRAEQAEKKMDELEKIKLENIQARQEAAVAKEDTARLQRETDCLVANQGETLRTFFLKLVRTNVISTYVSGCGAALVTRARATTFKEVLAAFPDLDLAAARIEVVEQSWQDMNRVYLNLARDIPNFPFLAALS